MDPSSPPKIIDQTFDWIHHLNDLCRFCPSIDSQFNFLRQYAMEFGVDPAFGLQVHTVILDMASSFLQDTVKQLFNVPRYSNPPLEKNQLVAAFTGFLLQILHLGQNLDFPNSSNLMVELRSLVAILGDTPFQSMENQNLQTLLTEFEEVVNEAGSTVHYAFFSSNPSVDLMEDKLINLLQKFHVLKAEVIDFLSLLPDILVTPDTKFSLESIFCLDSVIHDIEDQLQRDLNLPCDVKDLMIELLQQLKGCQSLFRDVYLPDVKFRKNDEGLKGDVELIRQVSVEAEYLIKSFMVGDAPPWYVTIRLRHLIQKLKRIGAQSPKLMNDCDVRAVKPVQVSRRPSLLANRDVKVDEIVPIFEEQEMDILDELVRGTDQRQCISVFGMAGIGKTTLAKKLYDHPFVRDRFDRRLWCTVSQTLERRNLLIGLVTNLGELDNATIRDMDEATLAYHVHENLFDRRFLLVVDDIWHGDHWDWLQRCFPDNKNGSRVLLTTRNHDVVPLGGHIHQLPLLSNDQCLHLLKKKMFQNGEPHHHPLLEEIGKTIASKCCGLPLVVVVLAGILSSMDEDEIMSKIVRGNLYNYVPSDEFASIMQLLKLSYENLSPHLKPCFLYLGVFQEDAEISIKKLKNLWIAEGFLFKKDSERAEDVAEQYVQELIDRNLIIVSEKRRDGGAKFCIIHDLLHDLCLTLVKEENFMARVHNDYSIMYNQKYPRLSVDKKYGTLVLAPFGLHLRSLFTSAWYTTTSLFNVKLLRALECCDMIGTEFLLDLRYLATDRVPPLVHRNKNLEFLIVNDHNMPVLLTPEILKMLKLRYLDSRKIEFGEDCETIETSSNLEYLATVIIRKKKHVELLRHSPRLHTLKCAYVSSPEETTDPSVDFQFLTQLESLTVNCNPYNPYNLYKPMSEMKLPSSIRKLNLSYLKLPWEKMSSIGRLPNLEVLKLGSKAFEGETWNTGEDEYPRLRYLKMDGLDFNQWLVDSNQQFPRLQQLVLRECCYLKEIPSEIGDISALCIIELAGSRRASLVKSAKRIQEEQHDMGNELELILKRW